MNRHFILPLIAAALCIGIGHHCFGQASDPACDSGGEGKPEICVRFDNIPGDPPEEGVDFDFDVTTDPDNPGITFLRGSDGVTTREYRVWSWDDDTNQTPENIGTIFANADWNYEFRVLQPDGDPGAANLDLVDLDNHDPDYFSRILDGEVADDLLTGLYLQTSSGGNGGGANLTIDGDLVGDVDIYGIDPAATADQFIVEGNIVGPSTINLVDGRRVSFKGAVDGDGGDTVTINVSEISEDTFQIGLRVYRFSFINIGSMAAGSTFKCGYLGSNGVPMQAVVTFSDDLPSGATVDWSKATMDGFGRLNFGANDIDGTVTIYEVNHDITAGSLGGTVNVKTEFGSGGLLDLSGSMGGAFNVNTDEGSHNFSGDVVIDGNMTGTAMIKMFEGTDGDFNSSASITVSGASGIGSSASILLEGTMQGTLAVANDLAGSVTIGGAFSGDVSIGDDFTSGADFNVGGAYGVVDMVNGASFTVVSNSRGDFAVTGDIDDGAILALNKLGANGRILVDGVCNGDIRIDEGTDSTSLIQVIDGLATNGTIVVNFDEGDSHDADGDIFIGNPESDPVDPVDPVTYDGVINILNGTGGGGDFTGTITVIGCHDDTDLFEFCICGSDTGSTKTVYQTDCMNQVANPYFTCSSSPCN